MANGTIPSFFLGANSPTGFFSLYDWLIDIETANRIYIIKGGPGCGKSSFMRRISKNLAERDVKSEYIFCSSDPDSLDGVVFPELGVAVVDGTAPHVLEPKYTAVVEQYVNLGQFYDLPGIKASRSDIIEATNANKDCYPRYTAVCPPPGR
ncbi:hypothetical protein FACS1894171_2800 [Clostridia bacterium]|nr:hypothetical protein FACS1894171_2800 [Clostridia bacterium]